MRRIRIAVLLGITLLSAACVKDRILVTQNLKPGTSSEETPPPEQVPEGYDPDHVDWETALAEVFRTSAPIPEIHLEVSEQQWNALLKAYDANHDTQEYVTADVRLVLGGKEYVIPEAGLRLKGNTSRRRPEGYSGLHQKDATYRHCHFGIDLQKNHDDWEHTVKGLRRFDLKWFKDDPAYVREVFCYDLFRRFGVWTAVRDVHARLWLRVEGDSRESYLGVYELMEHIDKDYLRARKEAFGHKGGNLWKCRWGSDLKNMWADTGIDDGKTDHTYTLKTNKKEGLADARVQLQDFIGNLNRLEGASFYDWLAGVMDIDLFLRTYAVNVAVGMWDDYWNNTNNYYLYFNTTERSGYKVFFIPYDYDNTLGTTLDCGVQHDAGTHDPYHWGPDDVPLMVKVLKNPEWKALYRQYLRELCADDGPMGYAAASARIRSWEGNIRSWVDNDTGEDTRIQDRTASWSSEPRYRLLEDGDNNYFRTKAASVEAMK